MAFFQYGLRFFRPIQDLSEKYNILQSAMAAAERIFKLLDTPPEIVSPADRSFPEGPSDIEFDQCMVCLYGRRLGAARCEFRIEPRRDGRGRRSHRRRKDDADKSVAAIL